VEIRRRRPAESTGGTASDRATAKTLEGLLFVLLNHRQLIDIKLRNRIQKLSLNYRKSFSAQRNEFFQLTVLTDNPQNLSVTGVVTDS
jgi:hypothetical protein